MRQFRIMMSLVAMCVAVATMADIPEYSNAKIYVNPGHGGFTSSDRNFATINHELGDTTGFYETNTNLWKAQALRNNLLRHDPDTVYISRTVNGITSDTTIDGVAQLVSLSSIRADVEKKDVDYFISIHSNGTSSDATTTNYLLFLYRGTDSAVGNGLEYAKEMATAAWPYAFKNEITYRSNFTTTTYVKGDITFYGSSDTSTNSYSGTAYTGYLGVLKHGCDGYLVEGTFHTYHPERHRLLNKDYCFQEGLRYARAIRAWFSGPEETTGDIMGTVKDATTSLENDLYVYKEGSVDAYYPLNNKTVTLQDSDGNTVATYTTDNEYNGVFVFYDLPVGTYTLDFSDVSGYNAYTTSITVEANTTVFTGVLLSPDGTSDGSDDGDDDTTSDEVEYYAHPEQDDDVTAQSSYTFCEDDDAVKLSDITSEYTIRRALLRNDTLYVLAHKDTQTPYLAAFNPNTGELMTEISTSGIVTTGYGTKSMNWTLSDIALTNDGVLIGTNSAVVGQSGNTNCTGDFYMYAWKGDGTNGPAYASAPTQIVTLPTNTDNSITYAGNNKSNLMANSIAINGDFDDFYFYFDSHAGADWTTTHGIRYVRWDMKDGSIDSYTMYDFKGVHDEKTLGEDAMMTLSPTALDRVVIDGKSIYPQEVLLSSVATNSFSTSLLDVQTSGANYFRYVDKIYMASPDYDSSDNTYGLKLYDITDGFGSATEIGEYADLIAADGLEYMAAFGVVDNADITLYLLVGDSIVHVSTKCSTVDDGDTDDDTIEGEEDTAYFTKMGGTRTVDALNSLTVRRALLHDERFYVLAHNGERTPYLYVVDPDDGSIETTMDLSALQTVGVEGNTMNWTLSDIAFTDDGVLIGANSVVIGYDGNQYCTGNFYMYAWEGDETTSVGEATMKQVMTLATNNDDNADISGNNYSNLISNSFAVDGSYDDFYFYFGSHAGGDWDSGSSIRYVRWTIKGQELCASASVAYDGQITTMTVDECTMMTLSPLRDSLIIDGKLIQLTAIKPSFVDATYGTSKSSSFSVSTPFSDTTLSLATSGATFFDDGDTHYMASPVYDSDANTYGVRLYDVTNGLGCAEVLGEFENLITSDALEYMTACGVVRDSYIDIYLLVGDQIAQVTTRKGFYLCGPAVADKGVTGERWASKEDTYNAVKLTYDNANGYYYYADSDGNETAVTLTAGQEFAFSNNLDFTRTSFCENDVAPVDMHTSRNDSDYAVSDTYEENAYALADDDSGYEETQYFNVLSRATTSAEVSASYYNSSIAPATFNLPTGEYTVRLYVGKEVTVNGTTETLDYYLIKDRSYRFYDPEVDSDISGYATYKSFYDCHAVLIPDDIDILYVTEVDTAGSVIYMSKVDKRDTAYSDYINDDGLFILPAHTPVVLATDSTTGDYVQWRTMEYYTGDVNFAPDTFLTANKLRGQLSSIDLSTLGSSDADVYVFGYQTRYGVVRTYDEDSTLISEETVSSTSVGFFKPQAEQSCAVNTVYLLVSGSDEGSEEEGEEAKFLYVNLGGLPPDDDTSNGDDATTTVDATFVVGDTATETTDDDAYYTLQGVRLGSERPTARGVYIRFGKKAVVK